MRSARCPRARARRSRSKPASRSAIRAEPEDPLTAAEAEDLMLLTASFASSTRAVRAPLDPERIAEHLGRRRLPRAA